MKNAFLIGVLFCFCATQTLAQDIEALSSKNPVKVAGSVSARASFYTAQQLAARRVPFSWLVSGGATVTLFNGIQVPFSFVFSEQDRSFSQPFNQFGMSPRYKGYTLHAGYRNLTFSEFSLAGQSILGGGGEIQKGKIRAGFMAGRFNRATVGYQSASPTFYRQGWAGRVGYGKNDNFIDLIVLSAADYEPSIENYTARPSISPAANTVAAVNLRQQFLKRFTLTAEAALSLFTNDQTARRPDSLAVPQYIEDFLAYNVSSEPALAVKSSLEYRGNAWGLGVGFQQIDAGYRSMGAYYLYNDMRMFSVAPSVSLLKGKLSLNANVIYQTDNLRNLRSLTTTRLTPSVGMGITFNQQFGLDLNAQYFGTQQAIVIGKTANEDNLQNNALYSLTATPRWNLSNPQLSHSVSVTGGWQALLDQNPLSKEYTQFNSITAGAFYALSLVPTSTSFNVGANYAGFNTFLVSNKPTYSFSAGGSRSFEKGKYSTSANASYSLSEFSNAANASGSFMFQPNKHHQVNVTLNALWLRFPNDTRPLASEQRGTVQYSYRF